MHTFYFQIWLDCVLFRLDCTCFLCIWLVEWFCLPNHLFGCAYPSVLFRNWCIFYQNSESLLVPSRGKSLPMHLLLPRFFNDQLLLLVNGDLAHAKKISKLHTQWALQRIRDRKRRFLQHVVSLWTPTCMDHSLQLNLHGKNRYKVFRASRQYFARETKFVSEPPNLQGVGHEWNVRRHEQKSEIN